MLFFFSLPFDLILDLFQGISPSKSESYDFSQSKQTYLINTSANNRQSQLLATSHTNLCASESSDVTRTVDMSYIGISNAIANEMPFSLNSDLQHILILHRDQDQSKSLLLNDESSVEQQTQNRFTEKLQLELGMETINDVDQAQESLENLSNSSFKFNTDDDVVHNKCPSPQSNNVNDPQTISDTYQLRNQDSKSHLRPAVNIVTSRDCISEGPSSSTVHSLYNPVRLRDQPVVLSPHSNFVGKHSKR